MQTISQLTAQITNNQLATLTSYEQKQPINTATVDTTSEQFNQSLQMVIDLFEDWTRMFGSKLQGRQNLDLRTAELWTVGLKKLNVTLTEFLKAKEESICMKWPPTCVEDFVALVRSNTSAYPDSFTAFKFACENEGRTADIKKPYSHVVVYETVKRLGSHALKHADSKYFGIWDKTYTQVIIEFEQGANFTIPESNRIEQKHIPADEKVADDHLAKIKAMLARVSA